MGIVEGEADQCAVVLPFEPDDRAWWQVLTYLYEFVAERPKVTLKEPLFFLVPEPDAGICRQFGEIVRFA